MSYDTTSALVSDQLNDDTVDPQVLSRRSVLSSCALGAAGISCSTLVSSALLSDIFGCADAIPARVAGLDLSGVDVSVRPQDDLFRHVNGRWLNTVVIPEEKSGVGAFDELAERNSEHLRQIIEGITVTSGDEYKVKALYDSIMNTQELEKGGLSILHPQWSMVDRALHKEDLIQVVGQLSRDYMFSFPMNFAIGVDAKNSSRYVFYTTCEGLGLSRKYLIEPRYSEIRRQYCDYLQTIYRYAGFSDAAHLSQRVFDFEHTIARNIWSEELQRDSNKTYNEYSLWSLQGITQGFSISQLLVGARIEEHRLFRVIVDMPSYYTAFAQLWARTDLRFLKLWIKTNILRQNIGFLPAHFRDASFAFYSQKIGGLHQRPPRWKTAVNAVDNYLGDALGKLYVQRFFPVAAKRQIHDLINNLKNIYRIRLNESWLTPATKAAAIAKLDAISTEKIGYPNHWKSYEGVHIGSHYYENILNISRWYNADALAKFDQPVDKTRWSMTPATVNAYYSPTENEIVFPAGILQPPFFDHRAAPAVNYGAIGAVIGHEISHAFDDQGARYDGQGNLHDWWANPDKARFQQLTQKLVHQYMGFVPAGASLQDHINGALTVGENAADLNGLTVALHALRAHYNHGDSNGKVSKEILQAAIYSWARIWREKVRPEALRAQLVADPHSPGEARVNQTVKNIDDFAIAFDVLLGDREYLPPAQRIHIW